MFIRKIHVRKLCTVVSKTLLISCVLWINKCQQHYLKHSLWLGCICFSFCCQGRLLGLSLQAYGSSGKHPSVQATCSIAWMLCDAFPILFHLIHCLVNRPLRWMSNQVLCCSEASLDWQLEKMTSQHKTMNSNRFYTAGSLVQKSVMADLKNMTSKFNIFTVPGLDFISVTQTGAATLDKL